MYRRMIGTALWHSTPECFSWPKRNYEEQEHPTLGKRCTACREIEARRKAKPARDRRLVERRSVERRSVRHERRAI